MAKKCHCCSALSQQGLRDVRGKKQWCFFYFSVTPLQKKSVCVFIPKSSFFFAFLPLFNFLCTTKPYISTFLAPYVFHFIRHFFCHFFSFFCHQPLINPFVATVYTFLYFLPLFLPLLFFFATFEPKRKKKKKRQMVVAKKWQKVKIGVKSALNTVMTQFVRLWWQKKVVKC